MWICNRDFGLAVRVLVHAAIFHLDKKEVGCKAKNPVRPPGVNVLLKAATFKRGLPKESQAYCLSITDVSYHLNVSQDCSLQIVALSITHVIVAVAAVQ